LAISISFLLAPILKKLFFSKINLSPTYEKIFEEKMKTTIISLIFIVLIFVINTLAYSKCLAINDNNIYLCESIGKAKYIEYTDAKYYKIDGYYDDDNEFYEEPNIEIVINGNDEYSYEISEGDFTQEELERVIASKMEFAGEYKTYIEFSDSVLQ
jgi:hypothetical protein